VDHRGTDEGDAAGDGRAYAEPPVSVLVETQHLACERHAEGQKQEKDPDDPGQFSWEFECSEEKDLHHVDEHNGDHEI
jgi:hypothetical protein